MTFPRDDQERQGLLPDFFLLKDQVSAGPAINPGTVQAHLPEAFDSGKIYELRRVGFSDLLVHLPGQMRGIKTRKNRVEIRAELWPAEGGYIHFARLPSRPERVTWSAGDILEEIHGDTRQTLTLKVKGSGKLVLRFP